MATSVINAVVNGAKKLYQEAVGKVESALSEYGESKKVEFPDTAYSLPLIYALTAKKINTLGELRKVLDEIAGPYSFTIYNHENSRRRAQERNSKELGIEYLRLKLAGNISEQEVLRNKSEFGRNAEDLAEEWLRKRGFKIISRNFRTKIGEIDIIAVRKSQVHFIEVKARRSSEYGSPQEAVNKRKLATILRVSQFFLKRFPEYKKFDLKYDFLGISFKHEIHFEYIPDIVL